MNSVQYFIKLSRPFQVLGVILTFSLGVGVARYLGSSINWEVYILGQAWVTLIQLGMIYLGDYFAHPADKFGSKRTPFSGRSETESAGIIPANLVLWTGIGCLAIDASITVLLIIQGKLFPLNVLIMLLILFIGLSYALPPFRISSSGYGELLISIWVAILIPIFAYLLQTSELHRLIPMVSFPLIFLHLAMLLAFEFPDYATDLKYKKTTLLVRLGWQRGMKFHNLLVIGGFALLGLAWSIGLPSPIVLPAIFVLIVGGFQVWMMTRIESGTKPNWILFSVIAASSFGLTTYMLAYGFWTRLAF